MLAAPAFSKSPQALAVDGEVVVYGPGVPGASYTAEAARDLSWALGRAVAAAALQIAARAR